MRVCARAIEKFQICACVCAPFPFLYFSWNDQHHFEQNNRCSFPIVVHVASSSSSSSILSSLVVMKMEMVFQFDWSNYNLLTGSLLPNEYELRKKIFFFHLHLWLVFQCQFGVNLFLNFSCCLIWLTPEWWKHKPEAMMINENQELFVNSLIIFHFQAISGLSKWKNRFFPDVAMLFGWIKMIRFFSYSWQLIITIKWSEYKND